MTSPLDDAIIKALKTQTEVAAECGVSVSLIQQWLRQSRTGNGSLPSGKMLKNLELVLQVKDGRSLFRIDWPDLA
jgi:transcriptional regulator with XRE-family HTH domain